MVKQPDINKERRQSRILSAIRELKDALDEEKVAGCVSLKLQLKELEEEVEGR